MSLAGELRESFRSLRHSPASSIAALLLLGIGLGAGIAVVSAAERLLFRTLPFNEPSQLVTLWRSDRSGNLYGWQYLDYLELAEAGTTLTATAGYVAGSEIGFRWSAEEEGATERVGAAFVTPGFFEVLGVRAVIGRTSPASGAADRSVALLAEGLWRRRFAADPDLVGRSVDLGGHPLEVIGIVPAGAGFPSQVEVWVPDPLAAADLLRLSLPVSYDLRIVARLAAGTEPAAAAAELSARFGDAAFGQTGEAPTIVVVPLHEHLGRPVKPFLVLLTLAATALLLIVCANLALLLLVRAGRRWREWALRIALGAPRGRLFARVLLESFALALGGAAIGLGLAALALRALSLRLPEGPVGGPLSLDPPAVAFAVALALASGVLSGVGPAVAVVHLQPARILAASVPTASRGRDRRLFRRSLLIAEVAIGVLLVFGALLLVTNLLRLQHRELGFARPGEIVHWKLRLLAPEATNPVSQAVAYRQVLEAMRRVPGTTSVGAIDALPVTGGGFESIVLLGGAAAPAAPLPSVLCSFLLGDYLRTLEVPLREGRTWTNGETSVALVDETFSRRFFPGGGALGERISVQGRWYTVIGVVGAVRRDGYRGALTPQVYLPYVESPFAWPFLHLVARAPGEARDVRLAMDRLAEDLPVFEVVEPPTTVLDLLRESIRRERFAAWVVGGFAAMASVLALIGVFAVTSLLLVERAREIAIHFALGATPWSLVRLVSAEALTTTSFGLVLGLGGAVAALRLLRRLFPDLQSEPLALVIAPLVMALGSAAAIAAACLRYRRRNVVAVLTPDA